MCNGIIVLGTLSLVHNKEVSNPQIELLLALILQLKSWLVGPAFDSTFEDFVVPTPHPSNTAARERSAIYRNRGFLQYLATLEWMRSKVEQEGTHLRKYLQRHLRLLEEERELPNRLHGENYPTPRIFD